MSFLAGFEQNQTNSTGGLRRGARGGGGGGVGYSQNPKIQNGDSWCLNLCNNVLNKNNIVKKCWQTIVPGT